MKIPFLLFGFAQLGFSIRILLYNYRFKKKGRRVKGLVLDITGENRNRKLFVGFTDEAGNEVNGYPANVLSGTGGHRAGDKIDVFYNPEYPDSFIADPTFETAFAVIFLITGCVMLACTFFVR
jgi:hypothetical protein